MLVLYSVERPTTNVSQQKHFQTLIKKKNYSHCYNRELKNQMLKYLETGDLVSGYTVST